MLAHCFSAIFNTISNSWRGLVCGMLGYFVTIKLFTAGGYRAAACDVIRLEAVVLPGGKTMERLYDNKKKFASFLLTSPALVIEHLQY